MMTGSACIPASDRADAVTASCQTTVYGLVSDQARRHPEHRAVEDDTRALSYAGLLEAVDRCAAALRARGVSRTERVAVLAENRVDYTVLILAAARVVAVVACLNWRQTATELEHCIRLVAPRIVVVSRRYAALHASLSIESIESIESVDLDALMEESARESPDPLAPASDAEAGLLILYTSGTTGRPKAALLSHRALIARMTLLRMDLRIEPEDTYLAWSPMFHMGGTEHTLSSLMFGASVTILDGFDAARIADVLARRRIGWLLLVPATIEPLLAELAARATPIRGVKVVGCMADLVPGDTIAAITERLAAPFLNSFGATETGLGPASAGLLAPGVPVQLAKQQSTLYELRLVRPDGSDAAIGEAGEAWVRGPTLFSGYFNDPEATARDLRDGWYRMGDLLRRNPDGTLEYVGRVKYLIKSGGENIYPAEIERVLLADQRVADAAVVRKPDARWGEVPVAFVAPRDPSLRPDDIDALCRRELAGYKRPREIRFVTLDELPRNATGKIQREVLEQRLEISAAPQTRPD
jgi:fatty-acyl-CoA synthase